MTLEFEKKNPVQNINLHLQKNSKISEILLKATNKRRIFFAALFFQFYFHNMLKALKAN